MEYQFSIFVCISLVFIIIYDFYYIYLLIHTRFVYIAPQLGDRCPQPQYTAVGNKRRNGTLIGKDNPDILRLLRELDSRPSKQAYSCLS